jgi:aryl-alcohol dehydrogenase-like predicted oxidoreductase
MTTGRRQLGRSGLTVSTTGLGCNNFGRPGTATEDLDGTRAVVHAALDAGITLFDTADRYGRPAGRSEELLGEALGGRRDEIVLATKFGLDVDGANGPVDGARGSRRYIQAAVHASLRRLRTDWIDLYQLHQPDPVTPMEETLAALDDLVRAGTVRYIGSSNLAGWQVTDAAWIARTERRAPFVSAQNEYSLLHRELERELLPAAVAAGVGVLPFFPLANGLLSGKYTRTHAPDGSRLARIKPELLETAPWEPLDRLQMFAEARGLTMLQVAFGWLLAQAPVASVIAGATTPEQVAANAEAGTAWTPTPTDLAEIDTIFPPPA